MEIDRVYYANNISLSLRGDEAVLVFGLRELEDVVAEEKAKKENRDYAPTQGIEVARIHLPRSLLHSLLTTMANDYQASQAQASRPDMESPQEERDVSKT